MKKLYAMSRTQTENLIRVLCCLGNEHILPKMFLVGIWVVYSSLPQLYRSLVVSNIMLF